MSSFIPPSLQQAFQASEGARLLTITNQNCGMMSWVVLRLLGYWLKKCRPLEGGKSEVAIVLFSMKHDFTYYASILSHWGINLQQHENQGHFCFIGNMLVRLLGDTLEPPVEPTTTLAETLDLLCDEAHRLKVNHARVVLFMDSPELAISLVDDNPTVAVERWPSLLQSIIFQFDNSIVSLSLTAPAIGGSMRDFPQKMAMIKGAMRLGVHADVALMIRPNVYQTTEFDGTLVVSYQNNFRPVTAEGSPAKDAGIVFKLMPDGHNVDITETFVPR